MNGYAGEGACGRRIERQSGHRAGVGNWHTAGELVTKLVVYNLIRKYKKFHSSERGHRSLPSSTLHHPPPRRPPPAPCAAIHHWVIGVLHLFLVVHLQQANHARRESHLPTASRALGRRRLQRLPRVRQPCLQRGAEPLPDVRLYVAMPRTTSVRCSTLAPLCCVVLCVGSSYLVERKECGSLVSCPGP